MIHLSDRVEQSICFEFGIYAPTEVTERKGDVAAFGWGVDLGGGAATIGSDCDLERPTYSVDGGGRCGESFVSGDAR